MPPRGARGWGQGSVALPGEEGPVLAPIRSLVPGQVLCGFLLGVGALGFHSRVCGGVSRKFSLQGRMLSLEQG